eukprot:TRINITY_DN425_c0_g1_i1.p1 TRINITY_DN425_c0_g1~~TRINITY_DN425_c0_g1_i1.p1  ORF type:complete len:301 (-),score=51.70 TRINITY_DN425_c0_g1_i1:360-1151(-)
MSTTDFVSTQKTTCRRFQDKVAIVTASTDGIGLAIARRLAQEGASVIISSRRGANVDRAVQQLQKEGLKAFGLVCHVSNADHRKELIEFATKKFGRLDVLVSNAAVNPSVSFLTELESSAWEKTFEVNVKNAFELAREAVPHMKAGASILFISSIAGFRPGPPLSVYGIAKTALFGLTKALAVELGATGIRVNCVAPGIVKTRFSELLWKNEEAEKRALQDIPLGRIGNVDDIAGPTAFLCSEDASWITGEILLVTGGVHARM